MKPWQTNNTNILFTRKKIWPTEIYFFPLLQVEIVAFDGYLSDILKKIPQKTPHSYLYKKRIYGYRLYLHAMFQAEMRMCMLHMEEWNTDKLKVEQLNYEIKKYY